MDKLSPMRWVWGLSLLLLVASLGAADPAPLAPPATRPAATLPAVVVDFQAPVPLAGNLIGSSADALIRKNRTFSLPKDIDEFRKASAGVAFLNDEPGVSDEIRQMHRDVRAWQNRSWPDYSYFQAGALGADLAGFNVDRGMIVSIGFYFKKQTPAQHAAILENLRKLAGKRFVSENDEIEIQSGGIKTTCRVFYEDGAALYAFSLDPVQWYIATHLVPADVAEAMRAGRWMDGMNQAEGLLVNDGPGQYRVVGHSLTDPMIRNPDGTVDQPQNLLVNVEYADSASAARKIFEKSGWVARSIRRTQ